MIQVAKPHLLFRGQKVFSISKNVEKASANNDNPVPMILIYESTAVELPAEWKEILDKLTVACKFKPEETIYINQSLNPVSLGDLQNTYLPKVILIFGEMNMGKNGMNLKKNYPYEMSGVKILRTETLEKLSKADSEKSMLWKGLKQMLNLK